MPEIKKISSADKAHGRGSDNYHVPAQYGIYVDGKLCGVICGSNTSYMGRTSWSINRIDENGKYRQAAYLYAGPKPLAHAKAWALNNF